MIKKTVAAVVAFTAALLVATVSPAFASGQYYYATGIQTAVTGGVGAAADIENPAQVGLGGEHSLWEIAVINASGDRVEIGWNEDHALYGDYNTHIFAFTAVGGVGQGYNAANPGWVDENGGGPNIGDSLTSDLGTLKSFQAIYEATPVAQWHFAYNNHWIGHVLASQWPSSRFTQSSQVQIFGEVWSASTPPCIDMGSGINAGSTGAARFGSTTFYGTGSPAVNLAVHADAPYTIASISGSVRSFSYGGPGSC